MISWLHNYSPSPELLSVGPVTIYWYGLFVVAGIISAYFLAKHLSRLYNIKDNDLLDLVFWLVIFGLIGGRLYDVLLNIPYYVLHPWRILAVWQGGLAIHGAIIAGLATLYVVARKKKIGFLSLTAVLVPGLALGQAIGRWGNYFNQEIFGLPTDLPWGIYIAPINRPLEYFSSAHFHPTFLYESLGCLVIAILLVFLSHRLFRFGRLMSSPAIILGLYLVLYSLLRFSLEFIRLDPAPTFGLRWPQYMSLIMILIGGWLLISNPHDKEKRN